MHVLRQSFLDTMSLTAATVTVVTSGGQAGRAGITVSAMTPVSADADAPMILVCINDASRAVQTILRNGVFAVNILRDDQRMISDAFSGRLAKFGNDKFAYGDWAVSDLGSPRLSTALAALDCTISGHQRQGTHHVIFGHVQNILRSDDGKPLVYCNRSYRVLAAAAI
ncbi:MAG: flavin reductase family protein [Oricola sp.]